MGNGKKEALERLVEELGEFLDSGLVSGLDDERDPPDRDCVRKGGPVHLAVEAVQAFYSSGGLPSPVPREAWIDLTVARDTVDDPTLWRKIAFKNSAIIRRWAKRKIARMNESSPTKTITAEPVARDPDLERRDKWIYEQCVALVPYDSIRIALAKKPSNWPKIESKQVILFAAKRYAKRHNLPPVPRRQDR